MVKLIALYKTPENPGEFDQHYADVHTPLVKKWPGLRKLEVAKIYGAPIGEPKHSLIAEMYFDDQDSLQKALASTEGKAAARDVMQFAANLITMFYAEVKET
ncbi:MAG: EthD family reductase [Ignavibacteriales bacterium]|nr:EthD family reductase [Ignavibacteriales bacterium]